MISSQTDDELGGEHLSRSFWAAPEPDVGPEPPLPPAPTALRRSTRPHRPPIEFCEAPTRVTGRRALLLFAASATRRRGSQRQPAGPSFRGTASTRPSVPATPATRAARTTAWSAWRTRCSTRSNGAGREGLERQRGRVLLDRALVQPDDVRLQRIPRVLGHPAPRDGHRGRRRRRARARARPSEEQEVEGLDPVPARRGVRSGHLQQDPGQICRPGRGGPICLRIGAQTRAPARRRVRRADASPTTARSTWLSTRARLCPRLLRS